MGRQRDIAIVGCGIGGLAAASFLRMQGHRVTIFDQFEVPRPVGSGLVVQPVGQAVLDRLGLLGDAVAFGQPITGIEGHRHPDNRRVLWAGYGDAKSGGFGLAIHRGTLFSLLMEEARSRGVEFVQGQLVLGTSNSENPYIRIAERGQAGPFDLVVDAAGAHSPISPLTAKTLAFGALWATVDLPAGEDGLGGLLRQRYARAQQMAGVLPIGRIPGDPIPKAAVFWSLQRDHEEGWRDLAFETWQSQVADFWPDLGALIQPLRSHDDLQFATYAHGSLTVKHRARIAHIGDAAHQASPQLGQGANMALLDAMALADCLAAHGIRKGLRAYSSKRWLHVAAYQTLSRVFTPMYQSRGAVAPWLRDAVCAPFGETGFGQRVVSRLISGSFVPPILGSPVAPVRHAARATLPLVRKPGE